MPMTRDRGRGVSETRAESADDLQQCHTKKRSTHHDEGDVRLLGMFKHGW